MRNWGYGLIIITLAIFALSSSIASADRECGSAEGLFARLVAPSRSRKGFAKLSSGREMYFEYQAGKPGKTVFLLDHGLGDSMRDLDGLAERLHRDGYGVLRVDHHGHGRTLERYRKSHSSIPPVIDYRDNVTDEVEIVHSLGVRKLSLVGHSYGGGLTLPIARALEKDVHVESIHQLAPYAYRLDSHLQDMLGDGTILFELQNRAVESTGLPEPIVRLYRMMTDPWREALRLQMKPATELRKSITHWSGAGQSMDVAMDPLVDDALGRELKAEFLSKAGKRESELTEAEASLLKDQVAGALAATKGIRAFDVFSPHFEFPDDIPIQVLIGQRDPVVPSTLLLQYAEMMKSRGYPIRTHLLPQGDHLFPQKEPDEVYNLMMKGRGDILKPAAKRKSTRSSVRLTAEGQR